MRKPKLLVIAFAFTEILIGLITLIAISSSLIQGTSQKSPQVLAFVLFSSLVSAGLGIGILKRSLSAYHLLLYFSSIVILSKVLIFAKIIRLNGALETAIPASANNAISILYHSFVIGYFTRKPIREYFGERRNVLFALKIPFCK